MKVIFTYLNSRTQRRKVGFTFTDLLNIVFGVPQGSFLRPLLFFIYICDLFLLDEDLNCANYTDDTTPLITGKEFDQVIVHFEVILFSW